MSDEEKDPLEKIDEEEEEEEDDIDPSKLKKEGFHIEEDDVDGGLIEEADLGLLDPLEADTPLEEDEEDEFFDDEYGDDDESW